MKGAFDAVVRVSAWLLAGGVVSALPALAGGLTNGNAEAGSLVGWTASSTSQIKAVQNLTQQIGTVFPYEGDWLFSFASAPGSFATLSQEGTIPVGADTLDLGGAFQSERLSTIDGDDFGQIVLQAMNSSNEVVAEVVGSPLIAAQTLQWERFSLRLPLPVSAVGWRVELQGTLRYGSYINVFYDDLELAFSNQGMAYPDWAALNITNAGLRAAGQDADGDRLSNLMEYACGMNPSTAQTNRPFWLVRGSDIAETDVDLFFRESLVAVGIERSFHYAASMTNAFVEVAGRGPYITASGEGYEIKRIRLEGMVSSQGFFKMKVQYSGE